MTDFREPLGPENTLATALRAIREYWAQHAAASPVKSGEPYPLLLVRPEGILAYYAAREAMSGWGSEFGYELVGEDWDLKYPPLDRALAEMLTQQVAVARVRQQSLRQSLAAAAPQTSARAASRNTAPRLAAASCAEGGDDDDDDDQPRGNRGTPSDQPGDGRYGHGSPAGSGDGSAAGSVAGGGGGVRSGDSANGDSYRSKATAPAACPGRRPNGVPVGVYDGLGGVTPGRPTGQGAAGGPYYAMANSGNGNGGTGNAFGGGPGGSGNAPGGGVGSGPGGTGNAPGSGPGGSGNAPDGGLGSGGYGGGVGSGPGGTGNAFGGGPGDSGNAPGGTPGSGTGRHSRQQPRRQSIQRLCKCLRQWIRGRPGQWRRRRSANGQGNGSDGGPRGARSGQASDGSYTALDAMDARMRDTTPATSVSSAHATAGEGSEYTPPPHIGQWEPTPPTPPKDDKDDKSRNQRKDSDARKARRPARHRLGHPQPHPGRGAVGAADPRRLLSRSPGDPARARHAWRASGPLGSRTKTLWTVW